VVAVLCLTLQSGQAKRLTKRQRKRVTWFYHVIGQSEASVIWSNVCKLKRVSAQRKMQMQAC